MSALHALAGFHFLRPLALTLLLALPLFWLAWRHGRSDAGGWRTVIDAHLLPHLIERIDGGPGRAGLVLATLLWALACVALAGPAWEREPLSLYRNQAARVLALELSPSMLAQDDKPNRLARARYKIDDILARSRDYQTALIGYGGDAFVAAPLTDDVGTVRNLVDALDPSTMPLAGNATGRAIEVAADLIAQAGLRRGEILLLADSAGPDALAAATEAHAHGLTVSVLGFGSAAGAPVPLAQGDFLKDAGGNLVVSRRDEDGLRALAAAGGGRYASLSADASDLTALLVTELDPAAQAAANGEAESARWRDRGPWLLLALLPLALLGFRRGWLMLFALALVVPAPPLQAASLRDLWQRPDQQAAAALAAGDAKHAAEVARSPQWRASAAYRAGDYQAAAEDYARAGGAEGAYNRGNALARLGRYEDAITSYDEALKLAPDMADAQANRHAVEEFLKQQQQQQQQGQSGQNPSQDQHPSDAQRQQPPQQGGQDGQPRDEQGRPQQPSAQSDEQKNAQGQGKQDDQSAQQDRQQSSGAGAEHQQGAAQAEAQAPNTEQQKELSRAIDQALAERKDGGDQHAKPVGVPAPEDEATREQRQAMDHLLERVPDDPGGLLRRKFQLEYQRRQMRGGDGG